MVLVTGGARSGKSRFAESLAAAGRAPVLYVATAEPGDDEMRARIVEHQRRRPTGWKTLEARASLGAALGGLAERPGTVLIEDLGLLASNLLLDLVGAGAPTRETAAALDTALAGELDGLAAAQAAGGWDLVAVTQEVGLGLVPPTALGRVFRDALGRANQRLAARADVVYLIVAGLPTRLKPPCTCHDRAPT